MPDPQAPDDVDDVNDETGNLAVHPDDPPSSGHWVDIDEVMAAPTEEEMSHGQRLGEQIDVDDDDSTGVDDIEGVAF